MAFEHTSNVVKAQRWHAVKFNLLKCYMAEWATLLKIRQCLENKLCLHEYIFLYDALIHRKPCILVQKQAMIEPITACSWITMLCFWGKCTWCMHQAMVSQREAASMDWWANLTPSPVNLLFFFLFFISVMFVVTPFLDILWLGPTNQPEGSS